MKQELDLGFDTTLDNKYDSLAEDEFDIDEDLASYAANSSAAPYAYSQATDDYIAPRVEQIDNRPATERIAELLKRMHTRRRVLLGIMERCIDPCDNDTLSAFIDKLQENDCSVFDAANLCHLLERAGAIVRVFEDGCLYDYTPEPQIVVIDGVEYLESTQAPKLYWLTTSEGIATFEADNPIARTEELLTSEQGQKYLPIYQQILSMCASEDGKSTKTLSDALDDHELLQKPRFLAMHFIDQLHESGAMEWKKTWRLTQAGHTALAQLQS